MLNVDLLHKMGCTRQFENKFSLHSFAQSFSLRCDEELFNYELVNQFNIQQFFIGEADNSTFNIRNSTLLQR